MQPLSWIISGVLVVVLVLLVAYLFYKSGFRLTELKLKWGIGEASMKREPGKPASPAAKEQEPSAVSQFSQEASGGGVVEDASIKAPADASVQATQKAEGEGSKLKKVRIDLE